MISEVTDRNPLMDDGKDEVLAYEPPKVHTLKLSEEAAEASQDDDDETTEEPVTEEPATEDAEAEAEPAGDGDG